MKITSAFEPHQRIPKRYTCLGLNISPPLHFEAIPEEAKSLVLIFEDMDASPKVWTHWMVFNIPPDTPDAAEGQLPSGGTEGLANNHSFGYEGPCPRYFKGIHHYRFCLFALSKRIEVPAASERAAVEKEMEGCILAEATLPGICEAE